MIVPQFHTRKHAGRVTATFSATRLTWNEAGLVAVSSICNALAAGIMMMTGVLANPHSP